MSPTLTVVDAGTLERGVYLTVQLLELGAPVVLALNMMDEVRRRGLSLDTGLLARLLGLPVVATVARLGQASPGAPEALSGRLAADPRFTPTVALALIAFTILYAPCFVTVAVMARETDWKRAAFAVVANTALGFAVAGYRIGRLWSCVDNAVNGGRSSWTA